MLSAEEILCSTQQVIAGLEALRGENRSLLESLQEPEESRPTSESGSVEQEKCGIIRQSLESIELGLSEAQVQIQDKSRGKVKNIFFYYFICFLYCGYNLYFYVDNGSYYYFYVKQVGSINPQTVIRL